MSFVELKRSYNHHSNVLSSHKHEKALLKNDSESPDDCARSDNKAKNAFETVNEVHKFLAGVGCYSGTVELSRDKFNGSINYTVLFEDGKYE